MQERYSSMRALPLAGAEFVRLWHYGNGKDSEAKIEVKDRPPVTIPMSEGRIELTFGGPVTLTNRALDDVDRVMEIVPIPEESMVVEELAVMFHGSDAEWEALLRDRDKRVDLGVCVGRLRFITRQTAEPSKD